MGLGISEVSNAHHPPQKIIKTPAKRFGSKVQRFGRHGPEMRNDERSDFSFLGGPFRFLGSRIPLQPSGLSFQARCACIFNGKFGGF